MRRRVVRRSYYDPHRIRSLARCPAGATLPATEPQLARSGFPLVLASAAALSAAALAAALAASLAAGRSGRWSQQLPQSAAGEADARSLLGGVRG